MKRAWEVISGEMRALATICVMVSVMSLANRGWPASSSPEFDEYGGWTRLWVPATGFFHIRIVRARPWIVDPLGNAFLWKGVSRLGPGASGDEAVSRLKKLGFTGAGPWASIEPGHSGIAYMTALDVSQRAKELGDPSACGFPDVFDPAFEKAADEQAKAKCAPAASDPWLVGYVTDGNLPWRGESGRPWGLVDGFLALPPSSRGKAAMVEELRKRYDGDVAGFNEKWGKSLSGFEQLSDMPSLEPGEGADGDAVEADRLALLSAIAGKYFQVTYSAIQRYDPTHMVFGPRLREGTPREVVMAMPGYAAAVWLQPDSAELPDRLIRQTYRDTGMAVLLSEAASTDPERWFGDYAAAAARVPFVIGYAWPAFEGSGEHLSDGPAISKANAAFYRTAAAQRIWADVRTRVPRYDLYWQDKPMRTEGSLAEWEGTPPMVLEISPYQAKAGPLEVTCYMMWDFGHVYIAGRVVDKRRRERTLTAYVADDAIELTAAGKRFIATLRPGHQMVREVGKTREKRLRVAMQPIYVDDTLDIRGYTFEGAIEAPVLLPVGFVGRFALVFHATGEPPEANVLSFPADVIPGQEKTYAEFVLSKRD